MSWAVAECGLGVLGGRLSISLRSAHPSCSGPASGCGAEQRGRHSRCSEVQSPLGLLVSFLQVGPALRPVSPVCSV